MNYVISNHLRKDDTLLMKSESPGFDPCLIYSCTILKSSTILSYNQQQANASGSNTTELSSRYVSIQQNRDDVQSSTKYALHDTFENMKAVNQQLQVVGKLLFSKNNDNITNELNQIDNATSCEYLHKLEQFNQELYRFIPIEPANIHHHPNINTTISTTNKFIQIPNTNLQSVLTDEQHSNFVNKSTSVSTNQSINQLELLYRNIINLKDEI
ncbi:hypothetical protein Smp_147770 [Schistosoma mansoni]|uniref:hypothetical protein n=1 Tax=Schistosoma mansoni TaxID=6183 RepID=UPI0001A64387|nr:hypothetical protein Smp_147770 [Schistosoma mansoni]|eukprot:XP_018650577.1 hypothetical protein Smp_147770 [Schistosoma mansoni]